MTKTTLSLITIATTLLSSCGGSKTPSFGDRVAAEGDQSADIAKQWNKGDTMIKKGESLIKSGKKMERKGRSNVEDGEDMIEKGRRLRQKAEDSYKTKPPSSTAPVTG